MLEIVTFILGPVQTNTYLVADPESRAAVVIDPAWDGRLILAEAEKRNWHIGGIWLTHAHFDHFAGGAAIVEGSNPPPPVALHPQDYPLWQAKGGAPFFGMRIDPGPEPTEELYHGQILHLGSAEFEVRHTPGHSQGHVVFYCAAEGVVFCGDVVFLGAIGRTDLPGGDYNTLINSIRSQILTLPDETRLFPGHMDDTNVGQERRWNPFLR